MMGILFQAILDDVAYLKFVKGSDMYASGPCSALCIKIAVKDEDGSSSFIQIGEGPKCEAVVQDKLGADDKSENTGMLSKSFSFVVRYWTRFVLAAVLIVLIVLVSVKVLITATMLGHALGGTHAWQ